MEEKFDPLKEELLDHMRKDIYSRRLPPISVDAYDYQRYFDLKRRLRIMNKKAYLSDLLRGRLTKLFDELDKFLTDSGF